MTCIAIIPARGGSRRIPRKNIREFHGKPIIAYSIECAQQAGIFNSVYVSTEDEEIADIALQFGAEVLKRPPHLSHNHIGTQEVMQQALHDLDANGSACCIYPCAPMLSSETLRRAKKMLTPGVPYVVPVATWLRDPGQFYFGSVNAFLFGAALHTTGTRMLWIDPATECDINTEEDWKRAEQMYLNLKGQQ